jgi:D-amino-acid dehydrogenase
MSGDSVIGAQTTTGDIWANNTILALGANTHKLAAKYARLILVRPVKGYSVTYDSTSVNDLPSYPVIDEGKHVGIVPIDGKLRAVGIAEFAGYDNTLSPQIFRHLDRLTKSVYPNLAQTIDGCKQEPWVGFRPMSADGLPYIGETSSKGLWVNTGHGHLGWTLAAGSAELLADLIMGKSAALDTSTFTVTRST